jgi:hypothetical protein
VGVIDGKKISQLKFVVVSPGNTKGTQAADSLPPPMRFMLKYVMMPIVFPLMGEMVHTLDVGAKRFVDAISDERYKSGVFYASKEGKLSGDMVGDHRRHERHGARDGEDAPRWGRARSGDGSLAGRPGIGAERAWKGRHRGFERRAVVDGHRRPRLSGEGRVRHLRPALRQRRVQHSAPLESVTEAIYDEMFNLNAKGPFFAVQKLAPLINRGGSVVLTTSSPTSRECPANRRIRSGQGCAAIIRSDARR